MLPAAAGECAPEYKGMLGEKVFRYSFIALIGLHCNNKHYRLFLKVLSTVLRAAVAGIITAARWD